MSLGTYQRLDVHVMDSNLTVIRAARLKIAAKHRRNPAHRDLRKDFYREMLAHHARERKLYLAVVSGNIF